MTVEAPADRATDARTLRRATVLRRAPVTPGTVRVTLGGPELAALPRVAPDGYLKMLFPLPGAAEPVLPEPPDDGDVSTWYRRYLVMPDDVRPPMRTYTLRARRHTDAGTEIDVDVVLHEAGPGRDWALSARPGDGVAFSGPYGLHAPRPEHDAQLLVGDASAVPAVAAIVESLPPGTPVDVVLAVSTDAERQEWSSDGRVRITWLPVDGDPGDALLDEIAARDLPGTHPYVWLAGEATVVRALRRHVRARGVAVADICFCGYWRRGRTEEQVVADALAAADRGETPED